MVERDGMGRSAAEPLGIARQGSYFVGGRAVRSEVLSTVPNYRAEGTVVVDQVYVRFQEPVGGTGVPMVLVHGCCLTGKTWETTPDGRAGWDELFLRAGHGVHVVDGAWRGRSASFPMGINAVKAGAGVEALPTVFFNGREGAWSIFRFGPAYPKVFPGLQFPLEAAAEFWKQVVPDWFFSLPVPNPTVAGLREIAGRLGRAVLVSHSQSGIFPFQVVETGRDGVAGIVAVEPAFCPDPAGNMAPYRGLPILILWGDYVEESERWAPRLAQCRAFVAAANAAGGRVELVMLPEEGFAGNSHMVMQDRNSHAVGAWVARWVEERVG